MSTAKWLSPFLVASCLAVTSLSALADSNTSGNRAGVGLGSNSLLTPNSGPGSPAPASVAVNALAIGWNYKYCSYVAMAPQGSGMTVKVQNTDGSYFTAYSPGTTLNAYQEMLIRACRQPNAYWAVYITRVSGTGGSWNAVAGY